MTAAAPPSCEDAELAEASRAKAARASQDLREIIEAYHGVTERLQESHETLQHEVLRLREQLASADAQLQRSKRLAALGEMAAGIAHEIRNPLAAIGLYAEMIEQDSVALRAVDQPASTDLLAGVGNNAHKITDAVRGLSGIVSDVLSFSGQREPRIQPIDVSALFSRVIATHQPVIERAGVLVKTDVACPVIAGDPDLLHQALLNLVRNAVDAMAHADDTRPQKSHRKNHALTLTATPDPDDPQTVRLTVADTGPGIDDGALDRLFNPFFTTRSTGTGLGLAIVHRIADAHAGTVAVHNDPHTGGAVFTLHLPRNHETPA